MQQLPSWESNGFYLVKKRPAFKIPLRFSKYTATGYYPELGEFNPSTPGKLCKLLNFVYLILTFYNASSNSFVRHLGGDRDSVVGITTRYRLVGPGFSHPSKPAPRFTSPPVRWILGPFPGGKTAGASG
jgi:hypothetical protein